MPNPFANHVAGLSVAPSSRFAVEWAACAPAVRAGSFFMACVADEHLLQSIRGLVAQALEEGWSQQEWVYRARAMLCAIKDAAGLPYNKADGRAAWSEGERRRYENDVRHVDSIARLKLILRTQSRLASGYREFRQAFEPFWLENYPGWRFVRQPGAKTKRPDHVEHENEVRLKTDTAFWLARNSPEQGGFGNPYPPFGFNSWCWVEPVGRKECEELGLLKPGQKVEAPDGEKLSQWDLPRLLQQRAEVSTEGLSGESIRRIGERCRERGFGVVHDADKGLLRAELPGIPAPPAGLTVPEALYRMLAKRKEPKREDYKTEAEWRKAHEAWRKRWGMPHEGEEVGVQAAHCNQYGHVPGCGRGNGVDKRSSAGYHEKASGEQDDEGENYDGGGRGRHEGGAHGVFQFKGGGDENSYSGGDGSVESGVGRGDVYAETLGRFEAEAPEYDEEELKNQALQAVAQLQAVRAGRKPAYLETDVRMVKPLAVDLPEGLAYCEVNGVACIYHKGAMRAVLGEAGALPDSALAERVKDKIRSGRYGVMLGYGRDTPWERPSHLVTIFRDGEAIMGFHAPADEKEARRFEEERLKDFTDAFPEDSWYSRSKLMPGNDDIKGAKPVGKGLDMGKLGMYIQRKKENRTMDEGGKLTEEEASAALKAGLWVCRNERGEVIRIHSPEESAALDAEWDEEMCMPKRIADLKRKRLGTPPFGAGGNG